jgi:hypothetical protein
MALKLITLLGTDRGTTKEAYIRISSYEVSKFGHANCSLEIFLCEQDARSNEISPGMYHHGLTASNLQIGSRLSIPLMKTVKVMRPTTVLEMKPVYVDEPIPGTDPQEYQKVEVRQEQVQVEKLVEVEEQQPSLQEILTEGVASFCYRHLRARLEELFGAKNVIDC